MASVGHLGDGASCSMIETGAVSTVLEEQLPGDRRCLFNGLGLGLGAVDVCILNSLIVFSNFRNLRLSLSSARANNASYFWFSNSTHRASGALEQVTQNQISFTALVTLVTVPCRLAQAV